MSNESIRVIALEVAAFLRAGVLHPRVQSLLVLIEAAYAGILPGAARFVALQIICFGVGAFVHLQVARLHETFEARLALVRELIVTALVVEQTLACGVGTSAANDVALPLEVGMLARYVLLNLLSGGECLSALAGRQRAL